jgi:ribonucrease Y
MTQMTMLAQIDTTSLAIGLGGGVMLGVALGLLAVRLLGGRSIADARKEAEQIKESAHSEALNAADKLLLEAEKKALSRKEEADATIEAARDKVRALERDLSKRENVVERKEEMLSLKESTLSKAANKLEVREKGIEEQEANIKAVLQEQRERLLQVAEMSQEQAKDLVLQRIEEESKLEAAKLARKITEDAELEAKEQAREITINAIQRYATEHTSESTVRSVAIPSDDMKGRIIGREGRNIRAIEKATGVDIIVDDTPGMIVVSCFDKIRQAVAVEALERLIADGRMHPTRIEEVVEAVQGEFDEKVIKFGKEALLEANLRGVNPKIVEAMGKLQYRTSFGQNVLKHSLEVAYISQLIADQLGLDGRLARRCGFLHDIGKAMDHEMEGGHPKIGMDFAKQYGENGPVLNAIGGHHGDIPSTSFYTPIVMAADAVSSARPGARRDSMERYIQRLNDLQDACMSFSGVTEAYAIQAGREVRVMVDAAKVGDDEAFGIATKIANKISEEMTFPGEIRVTVLRETRAIEIAR